LRNIKDYESMAMLDLSESERVRLKERFDEIAGGFSMLDAYDTVGVEPLVTVLDLHNIMREDEVSKPISADELFKSSNEQHDKYFRVPAAID